jgi:hypothetical protein
VAGSTRLSEPATFARHRRRNSRSLRDLRCPDPVSADIDRLARSGARASFSVHEAASQSVTLARGIERNRATEVR